MENKVKNIEMEIYNSEFEKSIEEAIEKGELSYNAKTANPGNNDEDFFIFLKNILSKENILTKEDNEVLEKIESIELMDKLLGEQDD